MRIALFLILSLFTQSMWGQWSETGGWLGVEVDQRLRNDWAWSLQWENRWDADLSRHQRGILDASIEKKLFSRITAKHVCISMVCGTWCISQRLIEYKPYIIRYVSLCRNNKIYIYIYIYTYIYLYIYIYIYIYIQIVIIDDDSSLIYSKHKYKPVDSIKVNSAHMWTRSWSKV